MAYIVKRTFGAEGERFGIGLQNEELIRKMSWGSNWKSLRLCIRWAVVPPGDLGQITDTRIFAGFCSGDDPQCGYYSAYTRSAIGTKMSTTASADLSDGYMTYNAGAGEPYYRRGYAGGYNQWHYGYSSSYLHDLPASAADLYIPTVYGGATQRRGCAFVEVKKPGCPYGSATQYKVRHCLDQVGTKDMSTSEFYRNTLKEANFVGDQTMAISAASDFTAPISEDEAPLDCITITWQASMPVEIYDIFVLNRYGI